MTANQAFWRSAFKALLPAFTVGLVGAAIVYTIAWVLADDAASRTQRALSAAYKPGLSELIYAQAMAESLANSDNPAGDQVQNQVFALAEVMKEREEFDAGLAYYAARGIGTALKTVCLEDRVLRLSLVLLTATREHVPACKGEVYSADLRAAETRRDALEGDAEKLRSDMAMASVAADDEGYPEAETRRRSLAWQESLVALSSGHAQLNEAVILVDEGNLREALELMRSYDVSSQSDLKMIEEESSNLETVIPQTQNWHERHHDPLANHPIWTELKLTADDMTRHLEFVSSYISTQYRNLGGVEGSISTYLEDQRKNHGRELLACRKATLAKDEELGLALSSATTLRTQLLTANWVAASRVDSKRSALQALLLVLQTWHLTWGIVAGLVTALLSDWVARVYRLVSKAKIQSRLNPVVLIVGFMAGTIVSVRLGDRLDELTAVIASVALAAWWKYCVSILLAVLLSSILGYLGGFLIAPESTKPTGSRPGLWFNGGGGALGALTIGFVLNYIGSMHYALGLSASADFGFSQLLALTAIGAAAGAIMGPQLAALRSRERLFSVRSHEE